MVTNTQIIETLFAHYAKHDIAAIMAELDEAVTWIEPGAPGVPFGGTYKGHAGVLEMFKKEAEMVKVTSFTPETFFANGDMVVVLGADSANVIATGKSYTTEWTMAFTLKNGKVTQVQTYMDTHAIAKAFLKG
jgi:uncharacterized protein